MTSSLFTDEQLTAFLDGELDKNTAEKIDQALIHDKALQQRLNELKINTPGIRMSFDSLLTQAPEFPEHLIEEPKPPIHLWTGISAAAILLLVGFWGGWQSQSLLNTSDRWHEYVAVYQSLYIPNTLNHIDQPAQKQKDELIRVSTITGKNLPLETLTSVSKLDYKRAQILGFEGKPLAQLTFLTAMDTPIALCIIRASSAGTSPVTAKNIEGMSAASWQQDGYAYLLIGGHDQPFIQETAEHFSAIL